MLKRHNEDFIQSPYRNMRWNIAVWERHWAQLHKQHGQMGIYSQSIG